MNDFFVFLFVIVGMVLFVYLWALLVIAILNGIKNKKKSKHPGVCDHDWNYQYRTLSVGLGSPDFNHYKCRYCGEEVAKPVPYKFG